MSGKRIALLGLALAVVGGIVVLVLDVTSSGDASGGARRVAEATGKTAVVDQPVPDTRRGTHRPALADDATSQGDGARPRPLEYVRDDGTQVRDHRASESPNELQPRPVSRPALLKIRNDINPLIKECGKALRQRDRAVRGKMQTDLTISVSDGRIRVEALDLQVQGLDDSEYTSCVRQALEGLELFAPDGQADVERHTLSLPFKVP